MHVQVHFGLVKHQDILWDYDGLLIVPIGSVEKLEKKPPTTIEEIIINQLDPSIMQPTLEFPSVTKPVHFTNALLDYYKQYTPVNA